MATRTDEQIAECNARLAALIAKKEAEDAARTTAPLYQRQLAVALHTAICEKEHPAECEWVTADNANTPATADWTEKEHAWWLQLVAELPAKMTAVGFTVTTPT